MGQPLLFNIGLHTAHHEHSRAHWSLLTHLHKNQYRSQIHPALLEGGLMRYMMRTFVKGTVSPRFRSQSLMHTHTDPLPPSTS